MDCSSFKKKFGPQFCKREKSASSYGSTQVNRGLRHAVRYLNLKVPCELGRESVTCPKAFIEWTICKGCLSPEVPSATLGVPSLPFFRFNLVCCTTPEDRKLSSCKCVHEDSLQLASWARSLCWYAERNPGDHRRKQPCPLPTLEFVQQIHHSILITGLRIIGPHLEPRGHYF